jgi:hypothetical protein
MPVPEGASAPVAGAIEYCEREPLPLADPLFVTNNQLLSDRMAMDTGSLPVATVAGLSGLKLPSA